MDNDAWLNLTTEDIIDPELPICDPHHHLVERLNGHYMLKELLQDVGTGHNIVKTVFVQCDLMYRKDGPKELRPVGETEFVAGIAGQHGTIDVAAGIVGFADLTQGTNVTKVLEAHIAAGRNRFRGIRQISAWDIGSYSNQPKELLLDPKFREGFACLQKYNLSFDAFFFHPQLKEVVDLAIAFPHITIIVDHIGSPLGIDSYVGKREEVFQDWKRGIGMLATCPNVAIKLGGLGRPRCGFGWNEQDMPPSSIELSKTMAPYFLWAIEQFGVDRCMFESNFPPDKMSYSYRIIWNTFKCITKDFSANERSALFHDTAVRIYRLETEDQQPL